MNILNGDMFNYCENGDALCVTTNGILTRENKSVMGAGVAKLFRNKFKGIDTKLGKLVKEHGNRVFYIGTAHSDIKKVSLFSFPTKHDWKNKSDLKLIENSCIQLKELVKTLNIQGNIYIPAPGCNNGGLDWNTEVKPILEKYFTEERFIICFKG